jgi:hypothetical protein
LGAGVGAHRRLRLNASASSSGAFKRYLSYAAIYFTNSSGSTRHAAHAPEPLPKDNMYTHLRNKIARWSVGVKLAVVIFALISILFGVFTRLVGRSNCVCLEQQTISKITEKTNLLVNMINIFDSHLRRDTGVFAKLFTGQFKGKFTLDTDTVV